MKKLGLIILITQLIGFSLKSQTVSTVTPGNFTDGLAKDHLGNVYCSDWGGNIVYKLDTSGAVSIFKGGFSNPNGIAVDDSNHIYICDHTANRIFKYDTAGTQIRSYSGFNSPAGIKKLPNSPNFIVVEYNFGRVKILEPNGNITQLHSGVPLDGPAGIAIIDTTIYIANFNNRRVYRFNSNNTLSLIVQLPSHRGTYDNLGFLTAMHGKLYATHISGERIYEIDPVSNTASVFAGSVRGFQDGPISNATFNQPNGILADPANNRMYISEAGGLKNLRIIDNLVVSTPNNKLERLSLEVYPNPTNSELNVKIPNLKTRNVEVSISNNLGQEIFLKTLPVANGSIQINLQDSLFPSGSYVVSLRDKNTIASKLFIVE